MDNLNKNLKILNNDSILILFRIKMKISIEQYKSYNKNGIIKNITNFIFILLLLSPILIINFFIIIILAITISNLILVSI